MWYWDQIRQEKSKPQPAGFQNLLHHHARVNGGSLAHDLLCLGVGEEGAEQVRLMHLHMVASPRLGCKRGCGWGFAKRSLLHPSSSRWGCSFEVGARRMLKISRNPAGFRASSPMQPKLLRHPRAQGQISTSSRPTHPDTIPSNSQKRRLLDLLNMRIKRAGGAQPRARSSPPGAALHRPEPETDQREVKLTRKGEVKLTRDPFYCCSEAQSKRGGIKS